MKPLTSNGLLNYLLQLAKDDSGGRKTGICTMGELSCVYYPNSQRHAYHRAKLGFINKRDARDWLATRINEGEAA